MLSLKETKHILGVRFFSGTPALAVRQGLRGGLVVVPSAPVLVGIEQDPALRAGVLGADLAITDSGLMVLMWWLLKREKLERVSGLEYLKLLLERLKTQLSAESCSLSGPDRNPTTNSQQPITENASSVFWVMPTAAARDRNLAWLRSQGFTTTVDDCYVAPMYPAEGPISDQQLLSIIQQRKPDHIILALGGGVQERLGFALKQSLEKAESGRRLGVDGEAKLKAEVSNPTVVPTSSAFSFQPSALSGGSPLLPAGNPVFVQKPASSSAVSGKYRPGIHCIGAAIGFLSGEQVRIPMWVDYLYLGWLWRSVSAPTRFVPRYWKATRLVWLMMRYGEQSPRGD